MGLSERSGTPSEQKTTANSGLSIGGSSTDSAIAPVAMSTTEIVASSTLWTRTRSPSTT